MLRQGLRFAAHSYHKPKVVHCRKSAYDIYIGRGSKWGNPYRIGKDGSRQEVISKFETYARNNEYLLSCLCERNDKILGCWCKPDDCHGDVLVKLVEEYRDKS